MAVYWSLTCKNDFKIGSISQIMKVNIATDAQITIKKFFKILQSSGAKITCLNRYNRKDSRLHVGTQLYSVSLKGPWTIHILLCPQHTSRTSLWAPSLGPSPAQLPSTTPSAALSEHLSLPLRFVYFPWTFTSEKGGQGLRKTTKIPNVPSTCLSRKIYGASL